MKIKWKEGRRKKWGKSKGERAFGNGGHRGNFKRPPRNLGPSTPTRLAFLIGGHHLPGCLPPLNP